MRGVRSSEREGSGWAVDPDRVLGQMVIDTPALVVDQAVVDSNIRAMQASIAERGVQLRPHAKTHKSIEIGRLQLAAGAGGLTVGTIGEAETFAAAGIDDLFIAYPVHVAGPKADRLRALLQIAKVRIGVDSVEAAARIAAAFGEGPRPEVLIEVDSGEHRSGVRPSEAGPVAKAAVDSGTEVVGVFTHGGHAYAAPGSSEDAARDEVDTLAEAVASLAEAGVQAQVVSAGSTPTARSSARPPINEERPGTYVFGDRQQVALGACSRDEVALFVASTVVSTDPRRGTVTLDAGAKSLARDRKSWMDGYGEIVGYPGATIDELYDYHAVASVGPGVAPSSGEQVLVVPNHACPVVNLFDAYLVVRDGVVDGPWRVDARGRSS